MNLPAMQKGCVKNSGKWYSRVITTNKVLMKCP